jgi:hypothetical protein
MPFEEEIAHITREHFGIRPGISADTETIFRADNPTEFDRMKADFDAGLLKHRDPPSVMRRCFVGPKFAVFLLCAYPVEEIQNIPPQLRRYYPVCTTEEIRRLDSPKSAEDVLLRLRADEIVNNIRLFRVFLKRREVSGQSWSLSSHFSNGQFESYLLNLPEEKQRICAPVAAGTAFLLHPNGVCVSTPWGPVIVVSESLENYLYYMNVFLLTLDSEETEQQESTQALFIAIRTMILTETPDFDLDPRGLAPEPVNERARSLARTQMDFVVGHEYAHILCGHVRGIRLTAPSVFPLPPPKQPRIFSPAQKQEFAADLGSLLNPGWGKQQIVPYVYAVHFFFYGLDLLEEVTEYLHPKRQAGPHPAARDRLLNLRAGLVRHGLFDEKQYGDASAMKTTFRRIVKLRRTLRGMLPKIDDRIRMYGSMYLSSNTSAPRLDRIHY